MASPPSATGSFHKVQTPGMSTFSDQNPEPMTPEALEANSSAAERVRSRRKSRKQQASRIREPQTTSALTHMRQALVLEFDLEGNYKFVHMTRADILNRVNDAAKEQRDVAQIHADIPENEPHMMLTHGNSLSFVDVQNVHMRDLRKLDVAFTISNEPTIMVRKQAVLISADPIRAVVLRNGCLIFVPDGADGLLSLLMKHFREHCAEKNVPYEFRALEAILATLSRNFSDEFDAFSAEIADTLDNLAESYTSGELETLRSLKNTVNEFESQVGGLRRALMDILDNEEDLRLIHLTKLYNDPTLLKNLGRFDPEDTEVMLEAYLQEIHSTRTKVDLMQHRIQNTESLVMLKLDSVRNYLLTADVIFSLVGLCLTFGTFVTGAFGMNLYSGLEGEEDKQGGKYVFWSVFASTFVLAITISIFGIKILKSRGAIAF